MSGWSLGEPLLKFCFVAAQRSLKDVPLVFGGRWWNLHFDSSLVTEVVMETSAQEDLEKTFTAVVLPYPTRIERRGALPWSHIP